jgi:SAM-dependent methyltransferase
LLDVACGTGLHLEHLTARFECEGLDLDEGQLEVARGRVPDVPLHQADMTDFDLGRTFDAVVCLFSSIGYAESEEALDRAVASMARHLNPGGVLLIEPWFFPQAFIQGHVGMVMAEDDGVHVVRMNTSQIVGDRSIMEFHYLVGTSDGVEHFTETHDTGLFPRASYERALEGAGLNHEFDEEGLFGRGLFIAVKPR